MTQMSGPADDVIALLDAAQALLRSAAAETLPPAALFRMERVSSSRARDLVASFTTARTAQLSPGWSDLVEAGEAVDQLLARLAPLAPVAAPRPPPAAVRQLSPSAEVLRGREPEPVWVSPPPPAVMEPEPAPVVFVADAPVARAPVADDAFVSFAPPPTPVAAPSEDELQWVAGLPDTDTSAVEAQVFESVVWESTPTAAEVASGRMRPLETIVPVSEDDDEATVVGAGAARAAAAAMARAAESADVSEAQDMPTSDEPFGFSFGSEPEPAEPSWISYEEPAPVDLPSSEPDLGAMDEGLQYVQYSDADPAVVPVKRPDEEVLPDWAARPEKDEDSEVSSVGPQRRPLKPRLAQRWGRTDRPTKVEDVTDDLTSSDTVVGNDEWTTFGGASVPAAGAEADEDRYSSLRGERMHMDDGSASVSLDGVSDARASTRGHAAAVQLAADGSSRVLGADDPSEPVDIELGDTRDYGDEEALEDEHTGILGVGVVEYDDELEEVDEVEPDEGPLDTLSNLPGAPELTPADISALFSRAEEQGRRNMSEGALLFSDVLDVDPARIDALLARGRLYLDLGDFTAAVSDFLRAESLQPRDPDVQVALGDLFYGRKDYGKAVSYFNRALAIDGDHAVALSRRGMAHYYRRQFNAAVEDLERARQLDPRLAHVDTYIARAKKKN